MTAPSAITRRALFVKLGLAFNGTVGVLLGVPIVGFLLSPVVRGRDGATSRGCRLDRSISFPPERRAWRPSATRWPCLRMARPATCRAGCAGSTRTAFRCLRSTARIWVARCAGFPQSGLFLCPCHGGAYYADGARASGPPERGLFEYPYKIERGELLIQRGRDADARTLGGHVVATSDRHAPDAQDCGVVRRSACSSGAPVRETMAHPVPRSTASWCVRVRQRRA